MEVFYNGKWRRVLDTRPGMIYLPVNGGMWAIAAGMEVRTISAENRNLSQAWSAA